MNTPMDRWLSCREVANLLGVSEITLSRWRAAGMGPAWRRLGTHRNAMIRYQASAVQAFMVRTEATEGAS